MLSEQPLQLSDESLPPAAAAFVAEGRSRFSSVYCFDFVPSDYDFVWRMLTAMPSGRFCEWGCGFGVITGLAELLGYEACGIELDEKLADAARELLAAFGLRAPITTGDFLSWSPEADLYFVYSWPGMIVAVEEAFDRLAPLDAKLLISYGMNDFRCKVRTADSPDDR